jgi:hypothetical protein
MWHFQHVHRRPDIDDVEPGPFAHGRMPSIGCDDEVGLDLEFSFGVIARKPVTCWPSTVRSRTSASLFS